MERCDGGCKGMWDGLVIFRRCDSPQAGVKYVRKVCRLMERCDYDGRSVQELREVCQLSGSVTAIREV